MVAVTSFSAIFSVLAFFSSSLIRSLSYPCIHSSRTVGCCSKLHFDLMETGKISLVGFRRCIKRFLKKLTFVRPADSQSLRDKYIKTTKIIKSIILSVYFNSIRNSLASFFYSFYFSYVLRVHFALTNTTNVRNGCSFFIHSKYFSSHSICSAIYLPSSFLMPQTKFNLQKSHFFRG